MKLQQLVPGGLLADVATSFHSVSCFSWNASFKCHHPEECNHHISLHAGTLLASFEGETTPKDPPSAEQAS